MPIQLFPQVDLPLSPSPGPGEDLAQMQSQRAHTRLFNKEAALKQQQIEQTERIKAAGVDAAAEAAANGKSADNDEIMRGVLNRLSKTDPDAYAKINDQYSLAKDHEITYKQHELSYKMEMYKTGLGLVQAGDKAGGLKLMNDHAPPGHSVSDIAFSGNDKASMTYEDGSIVNVHIPTLWESMTPAKDLLNIRAENERAKLRLNKEFGPESLKAGEVVSPTGQRLQISDLLREWELTAGRAQAELAKMKPSDIMLMKSMEGGLEQYNALVKKAMDAQDPGKWAFEKYGVDIHGAKDLGRTIPAEQVGGRKGGLVPVTGKAIESKKDPMGLR